MNTIKELVRDILETIRPWSNPEWVVWRRWAHDFLTGDLSPSRALEAKKGFALSNRCDDYAALYAASAAYAYMKGLDPRGDIEFSRLFLEKVPKKWRSDK